MIFIDDVWRAGRDHPDPILIIASLAVIAGYIVFCIRAYKKRR